MSPETTPAAAPATKTPRRIVGRVVSNKMDKTITVLVERRVKHPLYGKYVVRSTKFHAHDAENAAKEGDIVVVTETRPLSRLKRHRLVEILESSAG